MRQTLHLCILLILLSGFRFSTCNAQVAEQVNHFTNSGEVIINEMTGDENHNVYVTGEYTSDVSLGGSTISHRAAAGERMAFLTKLSSHGNPVWTVTTDTMSKYAYSRGLSVTVDGTDNAYMYGIQTGGIYFGSYPVVLTDGFLAKVNPDGTKGWAIGAQDKFGWGVSYTHILGSQNGGVYVAGEFDDTLSTASGILVNNQGAFATYIMYIDSTGSAQWAKHLRRADGSSYVTITDLAETKNGKVLVAGDFQGTIEFDVNLQASNYHSFIAELDPQTESWNWSKSYDLSLKSLEAIAAGSMLLSAELRGTTTIEAGSKQFVYSSDTMKSLILKADAQGNLTDGVLAVSKLASTDFIDIDIHGDDVADVLVYANYGGANSWIKFDTDSFADASNFWMGYMAARLDIKSMEWLQAHTIHTTNEYPSSYNLYPNIVAGEHGRYSTAYFGRGVDTLAVRDTVYGGQTNDAYVITVNPAMSKHRNLQAGQKYVYGDGYGNKGSVTLTTAGTAENLFVTVHLDTLPPSLPASWEAIQRIVSVEVDGSGYTATLELPYKQDELPSIVSEELLVFARWNGSSWELKGGTIDTLKNVAVLSGITAFSPWALVQDMVVGIDEMNYLTKSSIYPNPASSNSSLTIKLNEAASGITIYDMQGKRVYQERLDGEQTIYSIELVSLNITNGLYLLEVSSDSNLRLHKLIIQ